MRRGVHLRHGSVAVALVLAAGFSYLAVRNVDVGRLGESLRQSNYWWLLPALATLALGFFLRALRWRFLFSARTRPAVWPATEALLVGQFLNNVLPLRAGDAARVVVLHSLARQSRAETTGTVVIERVFDVLALLFLLFVSLPWLPEVSWLRAAGALAVALTLGLVLAIVVLRVYGERPVRLVLWPLTRLRFVDPRRVEAAVRNLSMGIIGLRSARLGFMALLVTLVSWLVLGVSFWLVMLGFDLGLSPVAGLLVVIATGLSLILPSAPAAVGVFEAATIVALAAYGIPQTSALSYALVVHALNVFPFVVAGLLVVNFDRAVLTPVRLAKRWDERFVAHDPGELRSGVGADSRGTGDQQDDVAEPADRHLRVDEV